MQRRPGALKAAKVRYSSASEYVRELIRADEKPKAEGQLEAKRLVGLNSAESELKLPCNIRNMSFVKKQAFPDGH